MSRPDALAKHDAVPSRRSDERLKTLAEITHDWVGEAALPFRNEAVRTDVAEGIARGNLGEFTTFTEITGAFTRFRG